MEFNIISRDPIWLVQNKTYIFTYQVDNKPERYKIKMMYTKIQGKNRFVFIGDSDLDSNTHFSDRFSNIRSQFIEEIEKWQKGGSYRKTHPIATTRYEDLNKEKRDLENRIKDLEYEMKLEKERQLKEKRQNYQSDINEKEIDKLLIHLESIINSSISDYCIKKLFYNGDEYLMLYDNQSRKYRKLIKLYDDQIDFLDIPENLYNIIL